ncbi:GNAT family N-acetyltransferase [Ensifer sp.]|jgi:RimJ/RimL family protein N-acetyltransferase|uniref:GNAT family N-acetyltransferase n=1 Tax=Ensifer sp. TaxID=1872086 RepID=UPI002E158955|nr:GNAT family N-acetyltransferase [Ensifer sp.]
MIDVRNATLDDIADCHRCLDTVAREGRWLSRLAAPPLDRFADYMAELHRAGAPQIVACDGEVVGWCDVRLDPSPTRAHVGTLGMGLLEPYRGQGIGRRLLKLAMEQARERGLERIELTVLDGNVAAEALYRRPGFLVEGRRIRDWKHDGMYQDSILMAFVFAAS